MTVEAIEGIVNTGTKRLLFEVFSPYFSSVAKLFFTRKCTFFSIVKVSVAKFAEKRHSRMFMPSISQFFSRETFCEREFLPLRGQIERLWQEKNLLRVHHNALAHAII